MIPRAPRRRWPTVGDTAHDPLRKSVRIKPKPRIREQGEVVAIVDRGDEHPLVDVVPDLWMGHEWGWMSHEWGYHR